MDSIRNPYTPNAGASPEIIVGRGAELAAFGTLLQRLARGRTEQSLIVTGLRGVGKTVLLNRFGEMAREQGWEVVELEASKHDDAHFREALYSHLRAALLHLSPRARWTDLGKRAAAAISSFGVTAAADGSTTVRWEVELEEGVADHGDLTMDLTDVLLAIGEAARERERGVVLLVDEVQFLLASQLEALVQAIHKIVQRRLPVTFVGGGLPQVAELVGDAKSYAERLFKFPVIGSLDLDDARRAFAVPAADEGVSYTAEALDRAVAVTQGYPYFIQELGYQAWEIGSGTTIALDDIDAAREAYETKLDSSFFRVRLDRATPQQTAYLRAMAALGPEPQKAADVARMMGRESPQVAPTRAQLIEMGLLYTPDHGYAAFTVPDFDKFMMRAVPELVIPEVRARRHRATHPQRDK